VKPGSPRGGEVCPRPQLVRGPGELIATLSIKD